MIGAPCLPCERKGKLVASSHVVGKTPMCNACFLEAKQIPAAPPSDQARRALLQVRAEARETERSEEETVGRNPSLSAEKWKEIQERRNNGEAGQDLADEFEVGLSTIFRNTTPPPASTRKQAPAARPPKPQRNGRHTGGNYASVIADLREKRARFEQQIQQVDAAIAGLEALEA